MNGFVIVIGLSLVGVLYLIWLRRRKVIQPAKIKQRQTRQHYHHSSPNPKSNKAKRRAKAQRNKRTKGYSPQIAQSSIMNPGDYDQSTTSYASSDSGSIVNYDHSWSNNDLSSPWSSGDSGGSWSGDSSSSSSSDSSSGDSSGSW